MNFNNSTELDMMFQASHKLMSEISSSYLIAIFTDLLDIFCGCICLKVFRCSKTLKANLFILSCAVYINDITHITYDLLYSTWHLSNYLFGIAEVMAIKKCFHIICVQVSFFTTASFLKLSLALARLLKVAFPSKKPGKRVFYLVSLVCYLLGLVCLGLSFLDTFNDILLIHCSTRVALGRVAQVAFWLVLLASDCTTLVLLVTSAVGSWIRVRLRRNLSLEKKSIPGILYIRGMDVSYQCSKMNY